MNWTKSSAIAEILSSIAVLATLVYLTIEIRQNSLATQTNTRQALLDSDQQWLNLVIETPELNMLGYKSELTDQEKVRLSFHLVTFLRMRENNWLQYQSGGLDEATWLSYRNAVIAVYSAPQARRWWQNFGVERIFDPEFLATVDEQLATAPLFEQNPHVAVFD